MNQDEIIESIQGVIDHVRQPDCDDIEVIRQETISELKEIIKELEG